MAKASKLPSGNWRCVANLGKDPVTGKPIRKSVTAPTKKAAEYEALQLVLRYRPANRGESSMLLVDAVDRYIKGKDGVLSVTTIVNYESIKRNYFKGLMEKSLNKITRNDVQMAVSAEAKEHSPKTVGNAYSLILSTLHEYHKPLWRELRDEPIMLPQKVRYDPETLDVEQVAVLLKAIQGNLIELPVLCGLWLCMRQSEIVGIRWEDVDFQKGTLHVRGALVLSGTKNQTYKVTKTTESDRYYTLHPYLVERFKFMYDSAGEERGEYVVSLSAHNVYRRFKTILRKNHLPDIRFHDLRHSNSSIMAMIGVPQYLAQLRGGWSTPATMQRVYTHKMRIENAGDKMVDEFFERLISSEDE